MALRLLVNHGDPERSRVDVPGVLSGSVGLFALVYGFSHAETSSWTAPVTILSLTASPILLAAFVITERRTKHPLLPLHIVWDRARGGAYTSIMLAGAGLFGMFLPITYYLQQNLSFSPVMTGLAFLPMTGVLLVTSITAQTRVLPRTGAKPLVVFGMTLGIVGMLLFTRLTIDSGYVTGVVPGFLIIGLGMGCIFAPAFSTATLGVDEHEAGIASAMVNTSQQVGGSVGLALLSTLAASATADFTTGHTHLQGLAKAAAINGYTTAFGWSAAIFAAGLILALLILPPATNKSRVPVVKARLADVRT